MNELLFLLVSIYTGLTSGYWGYVALTALMALLAHPHAYGEADDRGFTFRQYIREHFVPWGHVESVKLRHDGFTLWVKEFAFPLYFGLRHAEIPSGPFRHETPEIVRRITAMAEEARLADRNEEPRGRLEAEVKKKR
jgi:hypothetical protein